MRLTDVWIVSVDQEYAFPGQDRFQLSYKQVPIINGDSLAGLIVIAAILLSNATIKRAKKEMPLGVMAQWATAPRRQARDDALILIVLS